VLLVQVTLEALHEGLSRALLNPKRLRDGGGYQLRIGYGSQSNEEHRVLELLQKIRTSLKGQASLAGASRTGQGEQAHLLASQALGNLRYFTFAPHEWGGLHGQVVRAPLESPQRRETGGQVRRQELEDALGTGEVLQAVFP